MGNFIFKKKDLANCNDLCNPADEILLRSIKKMIGSFTRCKKKILQNIFAKTEKIEAL